VSRSPAPARLAQAVDSTSTTAAIHAARAAPTAHAISAAPGARKTLQLSELLGDAQGIDIDHNGHVYRLQITKAGKLILTK
jgi:hemin uptake protein HemP